MLYAIIGEVRSFTPQKGGEEALRPFGRFYSQKPFNNDALYALEDALYPKYSFVLYGKILEPYEVSHS